MWVLYDQQVQHLLDNFTPPPHFTAEGPRERKNTRKHQHTSEAISNTRQRFLPRNTYRTCETHNRCARTHQHARAAASLSSSFSSTQSIFFSPPRWKDYSDNKANKSAILQGSAQGQRRTCEKDFKQHFTERAAGSSRRQRLKSHRQSKLWQKSPFQRDSYFHFIRIIPYN